MLFLRGRELHALASIHLHAAQLIWPLSSAKPSLSFSCSLTIKTRESSFVRSFQASTCKGPSMCERLLSTNHASGSFWLASARLGSAWLNYLLLQYLAFEIMSRGAVLISWLHRLAREDRRDMAGWMAERKGVITINTDGMFSNSSHCLI